MNPRTTPRVVPDTDRYWAVELSTFGRIDFRFPYFAVAVGLMEYVGKSNPGTEPTMHDVVKLLPVMGASIGLCWFHETLDLDATTDPHDPSTFEAYGHAVADELQEAGIGLNAIVSIFNVVVQAMSERLDLAREAQEVRDFSAAPAAPSTS